MRLSDEMALPPSQHPSPAWRLSRAAAWLVILGTAAFVAWSHYAESRAAKPDETDPAAVASVPLRLAGRYLVGAHALLGQIGADPSVMRALRQQAPTSVDRLRLVAIVGELRGKDAALAQLDAVEPSLRDAALREDAAALRAVYSEGPAAVAPAGRERLVRRHGWFGELALAFGLPDSDPLRRNVLRAARRTCAVYVGGVIFAVVFLLGGLALGIVGLVRLADGKLRARYVPTPPAAPATRAAANPFLEAFAVYLAGFVGLPLAVHRLFPAAPRAALIVAGLAPVFLALVWPLLRGAGAVAWRQGLGWHAGRGWAAEIGAGLLGYLAGAPVLAAGIIVTVVLSARSHVSATHPIVNYLGGDWRQVLLLYVLACVWAPITEESMFRGALFHHLRRRWRWLPSAALVSLLFAAVHPQGWVGVPALFAIAMVLAALREWRGTLLASAAAHAFNNGVLLTLAVLALH